MTTRKRNTIVKTAPPKPKPKQVPVGLTDIERIWYEKEAAMIWHNNIIEMKLARGEEITEEDLELLDKATDAYEEEIRPFLTIEEIAEMQIK